VGYNGGSINDCIDRVNILGLTSLWVFIEVTYPPSAWWSSSTTTSSELCLTLDDIGLHEVPIGVLCRCGGKTRWCSKRGGCYEGQSSSCFCVIEAWSDFTPERYDVDGRGKGSRASISSWWRLVLCSSKDASFEKGSTEKGSKSRNAWCNSSSSHGISVGNHAVTESTNKCSGSYRGLSHPIVQMSVIASSIWGGDCHQDNRCWGSTSDCDGLSSESWTSSGNSEWVILMIDVIHTETGRTSRETISWGSIGITTCNSSKRNGIS